MSQKQRSSLRPYLTDRAGWRANVGTTALLFLGAVLGGALANYAQSDPTGGAIAGGAFTALARAIAGAISHPRRERDNSPKGGGKKQ